MTGNEVIEYDVAAAKLTKNKVSLPVVIFKAPKPSRSGRNTDRKPMDQTFLPKLFSIFTSDFTPLENMKN
jgi:hypothetical protein